MKKPKPDAAERWARRNVRSEPKSPMNPRLVETFIDTRHPGKLGPTGYFPEDKAARGTAWWISCIADILRAYDRSKRARRGRRR